VLWEEQVGIHPAVETGMCWIIGQEYFAQDR